MEPKIQKITHESQSSSRAMVASVDDLLLHIFLRVPMKPLIRFKSVSKHWQSLISSPGLGILRNPNPSPATGLILQVPTRFQLNPESDPYAYIVSFDSVFDYYVCNPTTNTNFKLPQIPHEPDWMLLPMCLAFDPSKSPHYKVVCVLTLELDDRKRFRYQFLVYSSETGCWRKSRVEPFRATVDFLRGVYWNGAIYWVSTEKTGKPIYFDPDDDRLSQEIMPTLPILHNEPNRPRLNSYYYFRESCGHLHYIDNSWNWRFDVYELRWDYSEWFVKFRIRDPCYPVNHNMPYLCAVVRGKSDDDSFSVFLVEGKFVRYNFLNTTRETICEVEGTPLEKCYPRVYLPLQHAESLCSV